MNRYAARGQWLFLDLELYANTVRVAHEQGGAISPLSRSVGDFQPGFAQRRDEFAHRRDIHHETEMVDTVRLDHTGCKIGGCYSMTSVARARINGGTVRPSCLAVLRLMTSSKVVGCWTGRSAGIAPLRIRPA